MLGIGVRRSALGVLLALAIDLPIRTVEAQPTVVVVRTTGVGDERALDLARAVRDRLVADGRDELPLPPERLDPDLSAVVDQGISAYHDLRPLDAIAALDAALASFERSGSGLERVTLIAALSYRALAAQALGRGEDAIGAVDRLVAIDPAHHPDAAQWPPSFRRLVDERRSRARSASLRLIVAPTASRVVVDANPVALVDGAVSLATGRHVVRVEARGYVPRALTLELPLEGDSLVVTLEPDPVARLRDPGPPGTPIDSLVEGARALGAEVLVVDVVVEGDSLRASLVDARDDRRDELLADAAIAAPAIVGLLFTVDEPAPSPERRAPTATTRDGTSRRIRRRRAILISAASAVVVASVISIPVALGARDEFVGRWQRDAR